MIHIYYAGIGEESAEKLASHIKQEGGECELHWTKDGDFKKTKHDLCVNWGGLGARKFGDASPWLNKTLLPSKLRQLELMDGAGIPVPKFQKSPPTGGDWLGRLLKHWDGNDLESKPTSPDFWVQRVKIKDEYRVHVFKGEVLRASLKVPLPKWTWKGKTFEGTPHPEFRIGDFWGFSSRDYAADEKAVCSLARAAVAAVGYDFGGVDVARCSDGKLVTFEVNAAPWLGGDAATKYAKRILALTK